MKIRPNRIYRITLHFTCNRCLAIYKHVLLWHRIMHCFLSSPCNTSRRITCKIKLDQNPYMWLLWCRDLKSTLHSEELWDLWTFQFFFAELYTHGISLHIASCSAFLYIASCIASLYCIVPCISCELFEIFCFPLK